MRGLGEVQRDPAVVAGQRRRGRARAPRRSAVSSSSRAGRVAGDPRRAAPASRGRWRARRRRPAARPRAPRPRCPRSPPPTPCQAGRKRARSTAGTGSTSARSAASERRRSVRSTSASQKSLPCTPPPDSIGRSSPSTTRPAPTSRRRASVTTAGPSPNQRGDVVGGERAVGAGVAGDEVAERVGRPARGRPRGTPTGSGGAERVAQPAGVLDGGPALLAGDPDPDQPAVALEVDQPGRRPRRRRCPRRHRSTMAWCGSGAEHPEQVGDVLGVDGSAALGRRAAAARPRCVRAASGSSRSRRASALAPAEQLGQQRRVEREGGGAPLGQRRVALVEELGDVAEHQDCGRTATASAVSTSTSVHRARPDPRISSTRPGTSKTSWTHSRTVSRTIGKRGVLAGHLEQLGGPLALLPERLAPVGAAARQQQGPGRALAEPRREQRRPADLAA